MHASLESSVSPSAPVVSSPAGSQRTIRHSISRRVTLILTSFVALLNCGVHLAVSNVDTGWAAGVEYLCLTLVLSLCTFAFWTRARAVRDTLQLRWTLIAAATLCASTGYLPSVTELLLHTGPARSFQIGLFNASEALYMLATVLFFARVARSIVIIDMLQALLFVVLRYSLVYSSTTSDHFTTNHLVVAEIMASCLLLVALVGCFGAASRAERQFLRTISWFYGLRLLDYFLTGQVGYTWLHHTYTSICDVPGTFLFSLFALYVLYITPAAEAEAEKNAPLPAPTVMVRSLMPSFLALVNLMLGLLLLHASPLLAAAAISVSLVCYVVRTAFLQVKSSEEKSALESRNEHLEGLAVCDPLTGIGNRRSLASAYHRLQGATDGKGLSILLIDIDFFKQANDCFGHLHGDKVLVSLAANLQRIAAPIAGSHCARFGGDEFSLLLPDISPQQASTLAEDLRRAFGNHAFDRVCSGMSLSIGVASLHSAGDLTLEAFIAHADKALYRSKLLGRNRVEAQAVWETAPASDASALRLELQQTAS